MAAPVNVAKIKIRRGLDSERTQIILDSGELGFTTDTQRLYVGDGVTLGGIPASNKYAGSYANVNIITQIEEGDFVVIANVFYIYNGGGKNNLANYVSFSNVAVDDITIGYNGSNQLYVKSISGVLAASVDTNQGIFNTAANKIAAKTDATSIVFNGSGQMAVGTINSTQHASQAGGSLHSAVTTSINGFMAASDKVKLNASPDWSLSTLTNPQTQIVIDSINGFTGSAISNIAAISSISILTGKNTRQTIQSNYFLNQQNNYNETLQPGSIIYSCLNSSKISSPGALAQWSFDTTNIASFNDNAFVLMGGDGRLYGYYYSGSTVVFDNPNIEWMEVDLQNQNSLMSEISSTESVEGYSYRLFDVYANTASTFKVKSLYPNYCTFYNNIVTSTGITITQDTAGTQSAALQNKLVCATTVSHNLPLSGRPTTLTITLASGVNGAAIDAANSNRYITIYDNNYVKNVFYFNNTGTSVGPPAVNIDTTFPGTVGVLHAVNYVTGSTTGQITTNFETALTTAGFQLTTTTGTAITFETGSPGYCLDAFTNYGATVITSIAKGGDYVATINDNNGMPELYRLSQAGTSISTSLGTPAVQFIKIPGVPAIAYAIEGGNQNSVALIKY